LLSLNIASKIGIVVLLYVVAHVN